MPLFFFVRLVRDRCNQKRTNSSCIDIVSPSSSEKCATSAHNLVHLRFSNDNTVDDHPEGYPQFAAYINSDDNFLIARKSGFLRSRVLLYRQDELAVLERDLIALDEDDVENEDQKIRLRSRKVDEQADTDPVYSRKVLIQKIDDKLKEYGILIY